MNKSHDKQTKLLAESLHDDWSNGRAAGFAHLAAAHARNRRRARHAVCLAGAAAVIAVASSLALRRFEPVSLPVAIESSTAPSVRGYEIISDEQLVAELRDRPLLVVQRTDGSREIVLLANE